MSQTEMEHYVPRFYLSNFTNAEDRLAALNISSGQSFVSAVDNVGGENGFYEVSSLEINAIEDRFSEVETDLARMLRFTLARIPELLLTKGPMHSHAYLGPELRTNWAFFILFQTLRTRAWREEFKRITQSMGISETGTARNFSNQKLEEFHAEWLVDPDTYERLVAHWRKFYFKFLFAGGQEKFMTSDHPVAISFQEGRGNGLGASGAWAQFPLTPSWCLLACDPVSEVQNPSVFEPVSDADVRKFNQLQIASAHRFVFAKDSTFDWYRKRIRAIPTEVLDGSSMVERLGFSTANTDGKLVFSGQEEHGAKLQ